ncbi:thiamine-phosphate kinase [Thermococcus chitonophagus]|uniref:Thiamine-monophosphate kinase n=1 Tax=Thermococcus chitonophagus TaxID=54262 RepID=A0A161K9Z5_9EURY|nr:thiamine-phosphate kinase [Thermococcus chitonophagus]ASJ16132.1 thiamine-phosphate kinase [Thermococcus chitonophagus]CUX78898.1 Thiamine-monophosphate kinase [Thermococcus chitonophagus]
MRESEIIKLFMSEIRDEILGDDAGYIRVDDRWILLTTDMLVWRTDVPDFMNPEDAGRKVVTMNVSDIAAMGGEAKTFFFSIGIPKDTSEDVLRGIARGIKEGSKRYGVRVVSGDTNDVKEIVVDGGALGISERLLLRKNAKPGDLVCVTGDLGRPLLALLLWLKGEDIPKDVLEKARDPIARIEEGKALSKIANAAIDISDGLSKELWEIARASNVRIIIDENSLPIHPTVKELTEDPVDIALASGEEFELIFTIPPNKVNEIPFEFTVIGRVERGNGVYLEGNGKMPMLGWEHFVGFGNAEH